MIPVKFITLGCPKNQVDSDYMKGFIKENKKFVITEKAGKAEVIVINTCGFINDAKQESIDTILEAAQYKTKGNCKALIVTGCLTQRYQDEILEKISEIDAILGTGNFDKIISTAEKTLAGKRFSQIESPEFNYRHDLPRKLSDKHYSYIKIAEGCNNRCSYCVIPEIRGPVNSRSIEDIIQEIKKISKTNTREIILIAQDITQYGVDIYSEPALVSLLKEIISIKNIENNIEWIRLLYSYPERISSELIKLIKNEPLICNYLDLPIQHSSPKIRKKMGRKGSRKDIINLISNLRKEIKDISLRTSLIVGFPGETEADFNDLKEFVKKIKFNRLGVFKYSREEGTEAASFPHQIDEEIKEQRYNEIMEIQQQISQKNNEKLVGNVLKVIIDEVYQNYAVGRSQYDAPEIDNQIIIYDTEVNTGEVIKCKITTAYEYDLIGEKINEFTQ